MPDQPTVDGSPILACAGGNCPASLYLQGCIDTSDQAPPSVPIEFVEGHRPMGGPSQGPGQFNVSCAVGAVALYLFAEAAGGYLCRVWELVFSR